MERLCSYGTHAVGRSPSLIVLVVFLVAVCPVAPSAAAVDSTSLPSTEEYSRQVSASIQISRGISRGGRVGRAVAASKSQPQSTLLSSHQPRRRQQQGLSPRSSSSPNSSTIWKLVGESSMIVFPWIFFAKAIQFFEHDIGGYLMLSEYHPTSRRLVSTLFAGMIGSGTLRHRLERYILWYIVATGIFQMHVSGIQLYHTFPRNQVEVTVKKTNRGASTRSSTISRLAVLQSLSLWACGVSFGVSLVSAGQVAWQDRWIMAGALQRRRLALLLVSIGAFPWIVQKPYPTIHREQYDDGLRSLSSVLWDLLQSSLPSLQLCLLLGLWARGGCN